MTRSPRSTRAMTEPPWFRNSRMLASPTPAMYHA
jgi:hypothetical protein